MKKIVPLMGDDHFQLEVVGNGTSGVVWLGIHSEIRGFSEIPILKENADAIILALQEVCY